MRCVTGARSRRPGASSRSRRPVQKAGSTRLFTGTERYLADALSKSPSDRQFDRIHSMATAEPFEFDLARGAEPDVGLAFDRLAHRFADQDLAAVGLPCHQHGYGHCSFGPAAGAITARLSRIRRLSRVARGVVDVVY